MGFILWIGREVAWAAGTHEYRPMGVAAIARTDLFHPSDFRPSRRRPHTRSAAFVGYFASIGQVNAFLMAERRKPRRLPPASSVSETLY